MNYKFLQKKNILINIVLNSTLFLFIFFLSTFNICFGNKDLSKKSKNSSILTVSHLPGTYSKAINFKINLNTSQEYEIFLINQLGTAKQDKEFLITIPSVVKISYKNKKGKRKDFIGNYIVNSKHYLPIVALYVEEKEFFPPTGIYDGTLSKDGTGKLIRIGRAWDKIPIPGFAQFFFSGQLIDELYLDVKTYGGMTLSWKEKSLQLSARKEKYGRGKIKVKLFKNLPFREYQHVVLRTSGNDQNKTRLKDLSLSKVAEEIKLNTKAHRQVVVYINGQYWGIHNLREKVNNDYFKYRYNWVKDKFIHLQGSGQSNESYLADINYAKTAYLKPDFIEKINEKIDIENYFNFNIFQTYISNVDYRGNVRYFKEVNGKWKWIVYDTDLSCGNNFIDRNFIQDRTLPKAHYWYNPPWSYSLLNSILKNNKLQEQFVNQYCYLLSSYLTPENFYSKINESTKEIKKELPTHFLRRNNLYDETMSSWEGNLRYLTQYFEKRQTTVYDHLSKTFGLSEPVNLKIEQNIKKFKGLKINNSCVLTNKVNGGYFKEYNLDVQATISDHLYEFKKWSNGITSPKITIRPGQIKTLKAIYKHKEKSPYFKKLIFKRVYLNYNFDEPLILLQMLNKSDEDIDLTNFILHEDVSSSSLNLKNIRILSGQSLIFVNDSILFKRYYKKPCKIIPFMTSEKFLDSAKYALVQNNQWVDSLQIKIHDSLLVDKAGWLLNKKKNTLVTKSIKIKNLSKIDFLNVEKVNKKMSTSLKTLLVIAIILVLTFIMIVIKKRTSLFLILLLLIGQNSLAQKDCDLSKKDRFGINSITTRSIDNKGLGDERFFGTRNFRVVLPSLIYRGGSNNLHLKDTIPKYYLWNPMPMNAVLQLKSQGFTKAIYLYDYNFNYWYPQNILDDLNNKGFEYICRPRITEDFLNEYLEDVVSRANDSLKGPMYIHCWNGWHQSGLLSAITLIQFCNYSNKAALDYWESCTDGNYKGFAKVRERISNYKVNKNFMFTDAQKDKYCPCKTTTNASTYINNSDDKVDLKENEMMQNQNSQPEQKIHIVKKGDTLTEICKLYNVSLEKLKKTNKLNSDLIKIGQKLIIN